MKSKYFCRDLAPQKNKKQTNKQNTKNNSFLTKRAVGLRFVEPNVDAFEALAIRHIVDKDDRLRSTIVCARQRAEFLLTRRVPDAQLHCLVFDTKRFVLEINAYFCVAKKKTIFYFEKERNKNQQHGKPIVVGCSSSNSSSKRKKLGKKTRLACEF